MCIFSVSIEVEDVQLVAGHDHRDVEGAQMHRVREI